MDTNNSKFKECYVQKRSGGRYKEGCWTSLFPFLCTIWVKRWICITNDGIIYRDGPTENFKKIKENLLIDFSTEILYGEK